MYNDWESLAFHLYISKAPVKSPFAAARYFPNLGMLKDAFINSLELLSLPKMSCILSLRD
jgi:hypothetical protein